MFVFEAPVPWNQKLVGTSGLWQEQLDGSAGFGKL